MKQTLMFSDTPNINSDDEYEPNTNSSKRKKVHTETRIKHKRVKNGHEIDNNGLLNMCKFCDFSADNLVDLRTHMDEMHENVLPIALLTPKISRTNTINKIRSARKNHEMLKCPKENCTFETPYYKKLQAHLKCHYDCKRCGISYYGSGSKRNLSRHVKRCKKVKKIKDSKT